MIGLVRVLPPAGDGAGTTRLDSLPEPPATRFSALAVRCANGAGAAETLDWYRTVRDARPALRLGLVCEPESCAEQLAELPYPLAFLLRPGDLVADGLPREALGRLRDASVEGRIFDEVVERYGEQVLEQEETIRALIGRACCGGTVSRAARDLGVAPFTVTRRLGSVGVSARDLRSAARLRAYEFRVELGVDPAEALRASGWTGQEDRRKAARRISGSC